VSVSGCHGIVDLSVVRSGAKQSELAPLWWQVILTFAVSEKRAELLGLRRRARCTRVSWGGGNAAVRVRQQVDRLREAYYHQAPCKGRRPRSVALQR